MLCRMLHCLPSQLEEEDAKTIEEFVIINNELIALEEDKIAQLEAEAKLKGMM